MCLSLPRKIISGSSRAMRIGARRQKKKKKTRRKQEEKKKKTRRKKEEKKVQKYQKHDFSSFSCFEAGLTYSVGSLLNIIGLLQRLVHNQGLLSVIV